MTPQSLNAGTRKPGTLKSLLRESAAVALVRSTILEDESGQDLVEYALIAGVVGLAAVASAHGVAVSVSSAINIVSSQLTSAI